MSAPVVKAFSSAYPGSMFERKDGGYVERDDAQSLAAALLALVASGDRAAEAAKDELMAVRGQLERAMEQRDELLAALRSVNAALSQNKTFPADVDLARREARAAIEKVQP